MELSIGSLPRAAQGKAQPWLDNLQMLDSQVLSATAPTLAPAATPAAAEGRGGRSRAVLDSYRREVNMCYIVLCIFILFEKGRRGEMAIDFWTNQSREDPKQGKDAMTVETMQVLILLLGSPVAWASR